MQGWQADPNGNVNTNASVGHREDPGRPDHQRRSRRPTMKIGGNLPADAATGTTINAAIDVYNSLGTSIPLRAEFTKVANTAGQRQLDGHDVYDSANNVDRGPEPR